MAVYSGHKGAVLVGVDEVAEVEGFSLDVSREIHDYVQLRSDFMQKHPGVGNWSGSLSARWNMADTNGQKALQDALLGGTSVTLNLEIDDPAVGTYAGTAYISSVSIDNSGESLAEVSFDFEGHDTPTFTPA